MVSKILTASALALSLSMGAFSFAAMAQSGTGTGGDAGSASGSPSGTTGTANEDNAGAGGSVAKSGTESNADSMKMFRPFYTDDSMKTARSQEEITSAFNSMSADEQAAMRGQCDGNTEMSACTMLPPKK